MAHPDGEQLANAIEGLTRRMATLEASMQALESKLESRQADGAEILASVAEPEAADEASTTSTEPRTTFGAGLSAGRIVTFVGRSLLIFGGGFLLRAFTESGTLPQAPGVLLGILYALLWMGMAWRVAQQAQWSAMVFGANSILIAYPLIWEATRKFAILSPTSSALVLTLFTGLGLLVAGQRRLPTLGSLIVVASIACSLVSGFTGDRLTPYLIFLLLLSWATLSLGYGLGWRMLAAYVAVIVNIALLLTAAMVIAGAKPSAIQSVTPQAIVLCLLAMVFVHLGVVAIRTLLRSIDISYGEILLTFFTLLAGYGGALAVSVRTDVSILPLGLVSAILAVGSYAASFAFVDRRHGGRRNFMVYTILALVFAVLAMGVLLTGSERAAGFATMALVTFGLGSRYHRATLSLHGALYALAAAMQSGLVGHSLDTLMGDAVALDEWLGRGILLVLALSVACCPLPVATHGKTWGVVSRLPKLVVLVLATLGLAGLAVAAVTTWFARGTDGTFDPGYVAAARTGILSVAAVVLAYSRRWERLVEARWLMPPLLVLVGLKVVLEDLRVGRASTLFLSLVLYGGALLLATRVQASSKSLEAPPDQLST